MGERGLTFSPDVAGSAAPFAADRIPAASHEMIRRETLEAKLLVGSKRETWRAGRALRSLRS
jgi:hypothetical protein